MSTTKDGIDPARLARIKSSLAQINALMVILKAGESVPEPSKPGLRLVHSVKKVG